jgi:hypothetical protein
VPNLQPGDRLWIHPDLPKTQSVKYLLICVFLRGNTNPPPENWFIRIDTWDAKVREEGSFVTVPPEAQQALMFMAPETGGDFSTLRSAVQGRPGAFVRASQDLTEAGFEQARIERYLASIRRVPPTDAAGLLKHSNLLARTLDLQPNSACFKQSVELQFSCLTQSGSQIVLDDGHGQSVIAALSNGSTADFISQASYTQMAGAGLYSAYVGAIVDLIRIMGNLHTAQYQYIPAISFPQAEELNLRLNTPPSFHNPKSVLVIALPSVQAAGPPPLRLADPDYVACLIKPTVTLPVEGAPLVFSTDFAHDLVLHFNTPPGAPPEPDVPLIADAYAGGLVLQQVQQHHVPLRDPALLRPAPASAQTAPSPFAAAGAHSAGAAPPHARGSQNSAGGKPVIVTATIEGRWGFDPFVGPTVSLQQLPGRDWTVVPRRSAGSAGSSDETGADLIAGHTGQIFVTSTGSACIHTITAQPEGQSTPVELSFKPVPTPDQPNLIAVTLPIVQDVTPGDLHLTIQQFDQLDVDEVSARTFSEPSHITGVEFHAGDRMVVLQGTRLNEVAHLTLGDLTFSPGPDSGLPGSDDSGTEGTLELELPPRVATPSTQVNSHFTAEITLRDGRLLSVPVVVSAPRPVISVLRKTVEPPPNSTIALSDPDDLPLTSRLTFTLKSPTPFPRNGEVEIETLDGTLRTVLTLAPSGGLVLQDPHTIVATLDPQRSFGPSAFGALRLRAIYPAVSRTRSRDEGGQAISQNSANSNGSAAGGSGSGGGSASGDDATFAESDQGALASDWLPLVTLVRLPQFSLLQCPPESALPCTVSGSNLFLLQSISTSPEFSDPVPVPDGYTGETLTVPHPTAATLFLKLRDDPGSIDSVVLPVPKPPPAVARERSRRHSETAAQSADSSAAGGSGAASAGHRASGAAAPAGTSAAAPAGTSAAAPGAPASGAPAAAPGATSTGASAPAATPAAAAAGTPAAVAPAATPQSSPAAPPPAGSAPHVP